MNKKKQTEEIKNKKTSVDNKKKKPAKKRTGRTSKYQKQAAELGGKLIEMNDKYIRLSAEFDNYRKRTLKEKMELTRTAGESTLINFLPFLDNIERAIDSIEKTDDKESLKKGIFLIFQNMKDFMKQNGIREVEAIDEDFNTDIHEAVTKIPVSSKKQKGKVVDCIEKGYFLHDKVIRYAKVVVGE